MDNQETGQTKCYICGKVQEVDNHGHPIEMWFVNSYGLHPWKRIPKENSAHSDCYIDKCIKDYLDKFFPHI